MGSRVRACCSHLHPFWRCFCSTVCRLRLVGFGKGNAGGDRVLQIDATTMRVQLHCVLDRLSTEAHCPHLYARIRHTMQLREDSLRHVGRSALCRRVALTLFPRGLHHHGKGVGFGRGC